MSDFKYEYTDNKYFQRYRKKKEKLQEQYKDVIVGNSFKPGPRKKLVYTKEERAKYQEYLRKLADLLFEPNGWFQKFEWDTLNSVEQSARERRARGRKNTNDYGY